MKLAVSILLVVLLLAPPAALGQAAAVSNRAKAIELFERGEKAMANKEYFKAQAHYTEAVRLDPKYAEAYRARGIAREYLGESAKALTDFNIYVDLRPEDSEALFNRAVLRFEAKQYLPARQDFLKLLTMAPTKETGTVYYSQEKFGNGATTIATAQSGRRDHLFNYLGQIETHLKRYPNAITYLDSAIRLSPSSAGYYVNRGIARLERGDKAGAAEDYETALRLDPDNSLALHNLAALKSLTGDSHAAEKLLSESIEKNEKLPYPRAERGYQRLQSGDLKGALEDYNEVVRLEPNEPDNYINRGLVKEKLKDYAGALADYSHALKLDEKNPKAWVSRGNAVSKLGNWKEALEDYSAAITLDGTYALAYFNRGIAHQNSGNTTSACQDLKKAQQLGVKEAASVVAKLCK
jgi:tetratricopeptide (TPR) repeat protein